jgi:hypothetical protein
MRGKDERGQANRQKLQTDDHHGRRKIPAPVAPGQSTSIFDGSRSFLLIVPAVAALTLGHSCPILQE